MKNTLLKGLLLLLAFNVLEASAENALVPSANDVQIQSYTRETDYTIGSVARQHLSIELPLGYRLDEGSLPEKAQTDAVELRDVHWHIEDKKNTTRYTFAIDWQIFVAAEVIKSVPLKHLALVFKRAQQSLTVNVPADKVLVSDLLPVKMDAAHAQPYPEITPQSFSQRLFWCVLLASALLLVSAMVYFAWYLGWIEFAKTVQRPFRKAWKGIQALPANEASIKPAMQMVSHAYDRYAGQAVNLEALTPLFEKHQALVSMRKETEAFFQDLQQTFYANKPPQASLLALKKLAQQLSRATE